MSFPLRVTATPKLDSISSAKLSTLSARKRPLIRNAPSSACAITSRRAFRRLKWATTSDNGMESKTKLLPCHARSRSNSTADTVSTTGAAIARSASSATTARCPAPTWASPRGWTTGTGDGATGEFTFTFPSVTSTTTESGASRTLNAVPTARTATPWASTMKGRAEFFATEK